MSLTAQEQSILKTLSHFDVLDYPLTLLEITKFTESGISTETILDALTREPLGRFIEQRQGLYYLKGRKSIVPLRFMRYRLALLKLRRARRFAALFSYFPWIRGVAIYSSLSLKNSRDSSDIDLFFITAAGRAWSARFWLNIFLKLFRLRPTAVDSRNKLCASYFVDENNLDLSFANTESDYFYAYGCASFDFLAATAGLADKFWQANSWINNILPAWRPTQSSANNKSNSILKRAQTLKENMLGLTSDAAYRGWQMKILPAKYKINNDGKKVVLADGIIKLHDNDKRGEYNRLFAENFNGIMDYEKQN